MKILTFRNYAIMLLAIFAAISITSCSKDHDHDGTGHLHVYFSNRYGLTDALEYDSVKTGTNGRNFTVQTNQYYISNVRLITHDGAEVSTDAYLLAKNGLENEIEFEELAAGHYTALRFDVGIDSATNHLDPSTYDGTSPLALQTPSMHWSWNSGYIFFRLEGLVDTSAAKTGTVDAPWEMHLGTDANLVSVELPIDVAVTAESHPGINVYLNTAALLIGIDLGGADIATHTMDNMPLANKLKANIATAFTVE
jgi:hypothetical protein